MVDVEEQNLDRRRFVRKLLTLGAAAGVAGILATEIPGKQPIRDAYAASGSGMIIDMDNTGSSGTVLESDWANVNGVGTLNIINHGTATGTSGTATGVYPTAIYGEVSNADGVPVFGNNTATSGYGSGVYGVSPSSLGAGVFGNSTDTSPSGYASGVYGQSTSVGGQGVYGHAVNDTSTLVGVYGDTPSTTGGAGVVGFAYAPSGTNAGVLGSTNAPQGAGTQGTAYADGSIGVFGTSQSPGARPMVAMAASGQTANLQEWWNSNETPLSVVNASGSLGIGTAAPAQKLGVFDDNNTAPTAYLEKATAGLFSNGTWTSYYAQFEAANRNQTNGNVEYFSFSGHPVGGFSSAVIGAVNEDHANYYGDLFFWTRGSSGYGVRVFINQNGLVGIGTTSPTHLIHLSGGAYSDGATWNNASSVRWKDNIEPLTGGVETLRQLHPVAYNYKKTPAKRTMGFIAEEVGKVLPTIVDWDKAEAGYAESYDHVAILALTVQALKEQQKQISEHQSTIQQLREHNEKLQERIAILERTVKQCAAS